MDHFLHHYLKLALPLLVLVALGIGALMGADHLWQITTLAAQPGTLTAAIGEGIDMFAVTAGRSLGSAVAAMRENGGILAVIAFSATTVSVAEMVRRFVGSVGGPGDAGRLVAHGMSRAKCLLGVARHGHTWGTVRDAANGRPLALVRVCVLDAHGDELAATISDRTGRYGFGAPLEGLLRQGALASIAVHKNGYYFPAKGTRGGIREYRGGPIPLVAGHAPEALDVMMDARKPGSRSPASWFRWFAAPAFTAGVIAAPAAYVSGAPGFGIGMLGAFVFAIFMNATLPSQNWND